MARVLIADDEANIRDLARAVLERSGYAVLESATGPATWETLSREKVDMLLLDVMLPGMDGHSLLLKMSAAENLKNLPVIVVTALEFTQDMFSKFKQVKGFLSKPFTPQDLEQAARQVAPVTI